MKNNNGFVLGVEGFLLGGILGGAIALLLAPKSGEETRYDIKKYTRFARLKKRKMITDAKTQSHDLVKRAQEILDKSKSFASGKYSGGMDSFEKEMESLKAGFNKAIETYKSYPASDKSADKMVEEIFVEFDSPSVKNMDDELLPKKEGMRRRS